MAEVTVVTFKWKPFVGYRSKFTGEHVNILARMIARHYHGPHRIVCYTDDADGIDPSLVEPRELWSDLATVVSPWGSGRGPSCYRRLKIFKRDAGEWLGERILSIDLDTVVVRDLTPIFERKEPFVIWGDTSPPTPYNGSLILFTAGSHPELWEDFDPATSPMQGRRKQYVGSDQAWISFRLGRGMPTFGRGDGVYSYRNHLLRHNRPPPPDARLVAFHGVHDPWESGPQRHDWVRQNYR